MGWIYHSCLWSLRYDGWKTGPYERQEQPLWCTLDSTLDRYSELVSLFGICLVFLLTDKGEWFWMGVMTFAAMTGSVMVSYVRARAEGLDIECKVGFMHARSE